MHLYTQVYCLGRDLILDDGEGLAGLATLSEEVGPLLVGRLGEDGGLPHVGGQVGVGAGDGSKGGLGEVAEGTSATAGRGVAILNTGHGEHLLGGGGGDDAGTTGGGDQAHTDGTALASDLAGHGVGLADLVTPVSTANGDNGELGKNDGTTDGSGDFLGALNTETDVAIEVTDGNEGLEAGALTGTGLLLDGHDLEDIILELGEEEVDDLVLLDGEREEVDLLELLDLAILDKATQLGHGGPVLVLIATTTATTGTTTGTTTATTTTATTATATAESTTELTPSTIGLSFVSHLIMFRLTGRKPHVLCVDTKQWYQR
eukprot:Colp12_sorted_trinity150504_noHs@353